MLGITIAAITLSVCVVGAYLYYKSLRQRECEAMDKVYGDINGKLSSFDVSNQNFQYALRDYYIKSAYNCCAVGSYKNDYLSLDMLKYVLRQGVRFLDFAIYSIDGQPIVATSSLDNNMKTTYNYLYFSDILEIIRGYAFSSAYCPNPNDPIFIHLRIYSTSNTMIKNLGDLMQKYTSMFLNTKYILHLPYKYVLLYT
jgi:hypothetical protein